MCCGVGSAPLTAVAICNPKTKNKQPLTHASGRSFVELGFSDSVLGLSAQGTVLTAGSLQGPLLLSAPTARTRTHIFVPLVKLFLRRRPLMEIRKSVFLKR
jgi:hypothetical protein